MKNRYVIVVMCIILGISSQMKAQEPSYKILNEVRNLKVSIVSNNGEWIGGGDQGVFFWYNTITGDLNTITDAEHPGMSIHAITNSGMLVGGYGRGATAPAAYYKNHKWTFLPLPENHERFGSMANAISKDETIMGGYADGDRGNKKGMLLPCMWKLIDGEYQLEVLPLPEKDLTGNMAQGACIRDMSDDGSVMVGDYWGSDGLKKLPIIWTRGDNGKYTYRMWGENLVYNLDAETPGICPRFEDYVTAPKGTAEYSEQYTAWDKLWMEWHERRVKFYQGKGYFELRNVAVSGNGRWMIVGFKERGDEKNGLQVYRIDLHNNVAVTYKGDYNSCPRGILNDGTVIAFSPYDGYNWTGYVYKDVETGQKPLHEWIKEKMGIDISDDFLFTISVADPVTGEINEVDSILTGCCTISKDGSTVISYLYEPGTYHIINYYVKKSANSISQKMMDNVPRIYVEDNKLYIKGEIKELSILDVTGKNVYQTSIQEDVIPIGFLRSGVYLVRYLSSKGQIEVNKILVK